MTRLKNAGLKVTSPRLRVLDILTQSAPRHLSAEEIYKLLLDQGYDLGLATVYRVLTQLATAGLVLRHNFGDAYSVFELDHGEHHDHLVCIKCGLVQEFVDELIERRQRDIAKENNFTITDHSLYVFGLCFACTKTAVY